MSTTTTRRNEDLDIEDLDWKIKVELPIPNLDTPIEKIASAIKLFQAGIISHEKALTMIDMEDEVEKMRLEREKQEQEREQQQQQIVPTNEQNNNQNDNANDDSGVPISQAQQFGEKKTSIDRRLGSFQSSVLNR